MVDERVEQDLVFLGLIGMMDPPREEASKAVVRAKQSGIRVIMITGDHPKTAIAVAKELGIIEKEEAITGTQVQQMSDEALDPSRSAGFRLRACKPRAQAPYREGAATSRRHSGDDR